MKVIVVLFWVVVLLLIAIPVSAQDAVVVIPLNSSKGGPGDWKTVSVSSLGGIPRDSAVRTGVQLNPN